MNKYALSKLPMDVLSELAQRHRALRKQHQWSQAELAERSGVSLGSLKRFERTGKISLESLLKLSHTLNRLSDFDNVFYLDEDLNRLFNQSN